MGCVGAGLYDLSAHRHPVAHGGYRSRLSDGGGNLLIATRSQRYHRRIQSTPARASTLFPVAAVGGENVYNSRILHPAIALGAVFCNIVAIFYWNWYIATWAPAGAPAPPALAQHGLAEVRRVARLDLGLVVLGLIAVVVGFVGVAFGMKSYSKETEEHHALPAIGAPVLIVAPLEQGRLHPRLQRGRRSVQSRWNTRSSIQAAWLLPDSWGCSLARRAPSSGVYALFVYDVHSPTSAVGSSVRDNALLGASVMAVWVPIILGFFTALGLYRIMAFNFLSASAAKLRVPARPATRRRTTPTAPPWMMIG